MLKIIVPIYNSGKYLEKCLSSIAAQSFKDFQCILINDGSTDNSLEICKKISKDDSRFAVYSKVNGGQSSAIKLGLEYCQIDDYIGFVDSDDYLPANYYELLMQGVIEYGAELCVGSVTYCDENLNFLSNIKTKIRDGYYEKINLTPNDNELYDSILGCRINKLTNAKYVLPIAEYLGGEITFGEDDMFTFLTTFDVHDMYIANSAEYYYIQHPISSNNRGFVKRAVELENTLKRISEYLNKRAFNTLDVKAYQLLASYYLRSTMTMTINSLQIDNKDICKQVLFKLTQWPDFDLACKGVNATGIKDKILFYMFKNKHISILINSVLLTRQIKKKL